MVLYNAVMNQAVNAALRDYRFSRVQAKEIPNLEFEISLNRLTIFLVCCVAMKRFFIPF